MTDSTEISIVIPAFNEAALLQDAIPEIQKSASLAAPSHEIIIVDDGSTDSTWEVIGGLARQHRQIKGIKLSRNFGKESAIVSGLASASGSAIIVMDADLQHPPELIPEMVRKWREGAADIVEAVKTHRGSEPVSAAAGAKVFYWLMKRLAGIDLDNASDFKLLDRRVVEAHNRLPESSRFFRGIVYWLGFRRVQIPFPVAARAEGRTKWSLGRLTKLAIDASTAFSSLPLHIITALGIMTFAVSIVLGLYTLYMKYSGSAVSGFATVIILQLFIGSVLMVSLGIIGLYISRIYEEVKRRPAYVVERTFNMEARREGDTSA